MSLFSWRKPKGPELDDSHEEYDSRYPDEASYLWGEICDNESMTTEKIRGFVTQQGPKGVGEFISSRRSQPMAFGGCYLAYLNFRGVAERDRTSPSTTKPPHQDVARWLAVFWEEACMAMTRDLQEKNAVATPLFVAVRKELEDARRRGLPVVDGGFQKDHLAQIGFDHEPDWDNLDAGPGVREAEAEFEEWVRNAPAKEIRRLSASRYAALWPLILKNVRISDEDAEQILGAMISDRSMISSLDNPHMSDKTRGDLAIKMIIAEASRGFDGRVPQTHAFFLEMGRRNMSLGKDWAGKLKDALERKMLLERSYTISVICCSRDVLQDTTGLGEQLKEKAPERGLASALARNSQGREWARWVAESRSPRLIEEATAWNLEGVGTEELLQIVASHSAETRAAGMRLIANLKKAQAENAMNGERAQDKQAPSHNGVKL